MTHEQYLGIQDYRTVRKSVRSKIERTLPAYAGLNPKGFRSGSSVHKKTRISKEGRALLRHILYMPAIVACKHNPIVHAFCERLAQRGLPKMAIVAPAMRKLLHLVFVILKHKQPFDPNYLLQPAFTP